MRVKVRNIRAVCLLFMMASCFLTARSEEKREIVVYMTSWSDDIPDPSKITCINYAFAQVNETLDGIDIDNEQRLGLVLDLKRLNPNLKVVLSVGGWGGDRFSEMAADAGKRRKFAWNCRRVIWNYGIDGIDIDWEYPTQNEAGISSSPDDTGNFTKLIKELRTAIGPKRILTIATISSAQYINLREVVQYVDWVNAMTYDMGLPPFHNSPLHQSKYVQNISVEEAVQKHIDAGVPKSKLVMGIPFYGRGIEGFPEEVKNTDAHLVDNYFYNWDDDAMVPYLTDRSGRFAYSYDDVRSIGLKCEYAITMDLRGVMCWSDDGDDENGTLLNAVYDTMNNPELQKPVRKHSIFDDIIEY